MYSSIGFGILLIVIGLLLISGLIAALLKILGYLVLVLGLIILVGAIVSRIKK